MGIKNTISKHYLSDNGRFAQICNNGLFGGKQIICPEKLRDLDPQELALLQSTAAGKSRDKQKLHPIEKYRDILKLYEEKTILMICGIENQDQIHYAMPLRNLLYDTLEYESQRAAFERNHQEQRDLSGAELLSGFAKDDRLIPVLTLCVYWGEQEWDGPKHLHDMLDIPPDFLQYKDKIADYRLNLLEVCRIPDLDQYQGELKALLGFVRHQKDKRALQQFIHKNQQIFQKIGRETLHAMSILGNARNLEEYLIGKQGNQTEEGLDMCQALKEWLEDERAEGLAEGLTEGRAQGHTAGLLEGGIRTLVEDNLEEGIPESRILEKLQRRFGLTAEQAKENFEKYTVSI